MEANPLGELRRSLPCESVSPLVHAAGSFYATSKSLHATRIAFHFATSNLPSFSTSKNALNVLTNSRNRRIHSLSPRFGRAKAALGMRVPITAKHSRRAIERRSGRLALAGQLSRPPVG